MDGLTQMKMIAGIIRDVLISLLIVVVLIGGATFLYRLHEIGQTIG
jgi:hypothetical protein